MFGRRYGRCLSRNGAVIDLPGDKESPVRVVAAKGASDLALDMKRRNVINIIERFRTEHALQEEREMKNLPAVPSNGPDQGI